MRPTRNRSAVCARSIWIVERRPRNDRIEADFEDCDCAGDSAAHPGYQDLRGAGLCIRLSAGVSQYGDALLGVAVLVTYSPQNGVILLVIAFLISPFGLPKLAFWLLGKVQGLKFAVKNVIYR